MAGFVLTGSVWKVKSGALQLRALAESVRPRGYDAHGRSLWNTNRVPVAFAKVYAKAVKPI